LIKIAVLVSDNGSGDSALIKDSSVLVPPTLQTMPEATYSAELDVSGFAQEGVIVTVFLNSNPQEDVVADSDGEFLLRKVSLRNGKNRIWAVSRDKGGNESAKSQEMVVVSDRSEPVITIDSPSDGEVVNLDGTTVKGLVDEDANISVNGLFVRADSDGSFMKAIKLNDGENVIVVEAVDLAGNLSRKEIRVTYSR